MTWSLIVILSNWHILKFICKTYWCYHLLQGNLNIWNICREIIGTFFNSKENTIPFWEYNTVLPVIPFFVDLSASTHAPSVLYTTTRVVAFQSIIQAVAPLLNVFRFPSTTWNKYKSLLTWPLRPYGFNLCRSLAASPPFIAHLILFAPLTVAFFLSLEHIKLIAMSELCLAFCFKCSFSLLPFRS